MGIIVDNSVMGARFQEADATSVYIGSTLVFRPPPPIIHTPTTISKAKLMPALAASTDPVFKRSIYPLDGDVVDISVAGDKSVVFKNNRWFSQHTPVYLEADCEMLFFRLPYMTHIDTRGLDTSNVIKMGSMFFNLPNIVEIDVSEMDTSKVQEMRQMFMTDITYKHPTHHIDVKYGPKFLPTSLLYVNDDYNNMTKYMFGNYLKETDPDYQYQIIRPWTASKWDAVPHLTSGPDCWVYTSNLP